MSDQKVIGWRRYIVSGIAVILFVALAAAAIGWVHDKDAAEDGESVVNQWNSAIEKLGIEPVYPPQEDISVGDIYIVAINDNANLKLPDNLPARSVKIAHVDMRKQLEKAYSEIYQFPVTNEKPGSPDAIWPQKEAEGSIFAYPAERRALPIVLFPGFSFAATRSSTAQGGWLRGLIGAAADAGAAVRKTVDLRIPAAETYGLPNLIAMAQLRIFCEDWRTRPACTATGARRQLAATVDPAALQKIPDPNDASQQIYRYDIALYLVSRVFLTRSIETVVTSNDDLNVGTTVNAPRAGAGEVSGQTDAGDTARHDADARKLLDAAGTAPSGSITVKRLNAQRVSITQTLQRPVVIGFRAAKASPLPD